MARLRLPSISGREAVRAFEADGWQVARQSGSHIIVTKTGVPLALSVPNHRELKRGTLRGLIRNAGLDVQAFLGHLAG